MKRNSVLSVRNYYIAQLAAFKAENSYASSVKNPSEAASKSPTEILIEGYVNKVPSMSVKNNFGDLIADFLTPSNVMAAAFNANNYTPQISMSKKLAYKGITVDDINIEFNLFLKDDPIIDIFKPITDLLGFALPLHNGEESLRDVSGKISAYAQEKADTAATEAEHSDNKGTFYTKKGKSVALATIAATTAGVQSLIDLTSELLPSINDILVDAMLLKTPEQMDYDIFFYMGYNGTMGNKVGDYNRPATYITGPWLITSINIELGELVIHPGFPDTAKISVGLSPARTGDGQFVRDIYAINPQKQEIS